MNNLFIASLLTIVSLASNVGSQRVSASGSNRGQIKSQCPVIRWVDYPNELDYESPAKFEVRVEGVDVNKKLKFIWFVSAGRILSG